MGLSGCSGGRETEPDETDLNQQLVDAIERINGVTATSEFTYTLVGMFFSKNGWISGRVDTDATSRDELRSILDEVGRAIVEVHRGNYRNIERVTIDVVAADQKQSLRFKDVIDKAVVSVDDIADFYGSPRH